MKILEELDRIKKERYISPFKKLGIYLKPGLKHIRFMKRKIVRGYLEEAWNKKNSAVLERFIAPDYVRHCEAIPPALLPDTWN